MKGCLKFVLVGMGVLLAVGLVLNVFQAAADAVQSAGMAVGVLPSPTPSPTAAHTATAALTATLPPPTTAPPTSTPRAPTPAPPTAAPVPTAAPTPRPTSAAPIALPLRVRSASGWEFNVARVNLLANIDGASEQHTPVNGAFVAFVGSISNFTNEDGCVTGREFSLIADAAVYEMDSKVLDAAKAIYQIDYPGFMLGQCLNYDESAPSFLVFDANPYLYSWLSLQGSKVPLGPAIAVSSMFERPAAAAAPQQPASAADAAQTAGEVPLDIQLYADQIDSFNSSLSETTQSLGAALQQVDLDSGVWKINIAAQLATLRVLYSNVQAITPPDSLESPHAQLVSAMQKCDEAAARIATGLDNRDAELLKTVTPLITECGAGITAAEQQMVATFIK